MALVLRGWHPAIGAAIFLASSTAAAATCHVQADCAAGFCVDGFCCDTACTDPCHACSAAAKGTGEDGVCGLKIAGKVCEPAHCDMSLSFIEDAYCDADGNCVPPPPGVPCLSGDPCKFDMCSPAGCDAAIKLDGTDCGGGKVCIDGVCSVPSASSSSSSSASSSSSSSSGAGGAAGAGGAGGASAGGGSPYPPSHAASGCGCRASGEAPGGVAVVAALAALGACLRRRAAALGKAGPLRILRPSGEG